MLRIATLFTVVCVLAASAQANEVFVTKDAQGRPVYTDRPDSLPAERVDIQTRQTDVVGVKNRYDDEMQAAAAANQASAEAARKSADATKAAQLTAADKAKRCADARQNYQNVMTARRLYEPGDKEGERRYLDSAEIDAARADAKKVMDEFCAGQ